MICLQHTVISHKFARIDRWHISITSIFSQHVGQQQGLLQPTSSAHFIEFVTWSGVYHGQAGNRDYFIDSTLVAHLIFFFFLVSNYQTASGFTGEQRLCEI